MRIKLENLKKTYAGAGGTVTAVNDISLDIPENQIFGIIGKSGAGKSSLVRLISLLETPDEGAVYYNDDRVDDLSKKELIMRRRKLGMIFQNFNLLMQRNCLKNIRTSISLLLEQRQRTLHTRWKSAVSQRKKSIAVLMKCLPLLALKTAGTHL